MLLIRDTSVYLTCSRYLGLSYVVDEIYPGTRHPSHYWNRDFVSFWFYGSISYDSNSLWGLLVFCWNARSVSVIWRQNWIKISESVRHYRAQSSAQLSQTGHWQKPETKEKTKSSCRSLWTVFDLGSSLHDRKETQTAVVWSCLPFIMSRQNHLARHSERGKKTRQRGRGGKTP